MRWDDGWGIGGDEESSRSAGCAACGCPCACGFRIFRKRPPIRRGDTLGFQIQALSNAQTGQYGAIWPGEPMPPNTAPVNLAGWRVIFTAKYEFPDWDNQAVWQLDNEMLGGVSTPGTGGGVSVSGPAINTTGFGDGPVRLVYDVQGIDSSGNVHTFETGSLPVLPDVTRAI